MDLRNETDIERLRQVALLQDAELTRLIEVLKAQSRELDRLKGGEALQQALALMEAARAKAETAALTPRSAPKAERKRQKGHGPKAQPDLPRVTERFELDEPDRTCPSCGGALAVLAGMQETSEMIDVIEVQYRFVQVERLKYGCKCGGCVETAPGPERAVEGGRYSLRFAVKVASDKYCHHCPLTRQASMMAEAGLEVTSQALFDQCAALAKLLKPSYEAVLKHILAKSVIGVDQTGWPNLEKKCSKKWQVWCITAPGAVYHRICDDKSAATFTEILEGFEGTVVCDAAASHSAGAREGRTSSPLRQAVRSVRGVVTVDLAVAPGCRSSGARSARLGAGCFREFRGVVLRQRDLAGLEDCPLGRGGQVLQRIEPAHLRALDERVEERGDCGAAL